MDIEQLLQNPLKIELKKREHPSRAMVEVDVSQLSSLMKYLKEDPLWEFDMLYAHTAVDRIEGEKFELIYILHSTTNQHDLVVCTFAPRANPVVPTVSSLWAIAEWHEREVYDLMGIMYDNHPDLRRLMLDDDWVGFPLRKDYKDDFMLPLPEPEK